MRQAPLCFLVVALALSPLTGQQSRQRKVDELFARWNRTDTPGAAVAVVHEGRVVYRKGYGMANLEYGIPIVPSTIFDSASLSKQFGAFSILLLAGQGRLSLDDDIRRHIPEMREFPRTITLRHLLHHTSGIRDWPGTLALAGWRMDDVISFEQIIRMATRQRTLNFEPGAEYTYSNTGYNLLAETVQRVTGRPYREWTDEHVFRPLEMADTHFHDDHRTIVRNRAYSYRPGPKGYQKAVENLTALASSSLYTSVEDLARWVINFETGRVGGSQVVEQMQQRGVLSTGVMIGYAMGQAIATYRGLETASHGGSWGGFRTHLLRFPEQRFAAIVLSNVSNFNASRMARAVAELYLEDLMEPEQQPQEQSRPRPAGRRWKPARKTLEGYRGIYYNDELDALYRIEMREGRLVAVHARLREIRLLPVDRGRFSSGTWYFRTIEFEKQGRSVTGFRVSNPPRVRNVLFRKVSLQ